MDEYLLRKQAKIRNVIVLCKNGGALSTLESVNVRVQLRLFINHLLFSPLTKFKQVHVYEIF